MNILGMSYMYHDSAAVLLRDGEVIGAVAEERFTRVKHTVDFPIHAVDWCLAKGAKTGRGVPRGTSPARTLRPSRQTKGQSNAP